MLAKSQRESDDTNRQHYEQHLNMKMSLAELTHKREHRDEYRQGQAMQQTNT